MWNIPAMQILFWEVRHVFRWCSLAASPSVLFAYSPRRSAGARFRGHPLNSVPPPKAAPFDVAPRPKSPPPGRLPSTPGGSSFHPPSNPGCSRPILAGARRPILRASSLYSFGYSRRGVFLVLPAGPLRDQRASSPALASVVAQDHADLRRSLVRIGGTRP